VTIADIMTRQFEVVREGDTLLDAMHHLRDSPLVEDEIGIKCVIVLDAGENLVGVLTQSDVVGEILFPYFVRALADRRESSPCIMESDYKALAAWAAKVKVRDVMSCCPVVLGSDAGLFEAADTIVSRKIKSLPVVDNGQVVGIVYRSSLYRRLAESILAQASRGKTTEHVG